MLFNSYPFLLVYLPVTLIGFFWAGRRLGLTAAIVWLGIASLAFYAWWDWRYVALLVGSIAFNAMCGKTIAARVNAGRRDRAKWLLALGVCANLAVLAYYKYANFFLGTVASLAGLPPPGLEVVLPLGISFFTFTQIAYLVDGYRGEVESFSYSRYFLFVTYFPHLIAGPVLHHREMMPQFADAGIARPTAEGFAVGLTMFGIGLFKKAVLADGIAPYSNAVFNAAAGGEAPTLLFAWGGALAYTCQLYFDFSGYSDMAVGLSRMFGIRLPVNFDSPYKAQNITDFWRRWHMTLSRFLRDYLYIPLGGNRQGPTRRYVNLLATMLLGGLWHGAAWTFVWWGALHGLYLVINHGWRHVIERAGLLAMTRMRAYRIAAWALTFLAVVVGWVFFRAESFDAARRILAGMAGLNGVSVPAAIAGLTGGQAALEAMGVAIDFGRGREFLLTWAWVIPLTVIALLMPNSQQILARFAPALERFDPARVPALLLWRPTAGWAFALAVLAAAGIASLARHSEFLYYQF